MHGATSAYACLPLRRPGGAIHLVRERAPLERTYGWSGGAASMAKRVEALTPALSQGEGEMQASACGEGRCGKQKRRSLWAAGEMNTLYC